MSRSRIAIAAAAVIALALSTAPVGAQSAREEREAVRRQQAEAAAELDTLQATDAELEEAVANYDAYIRNQEAAVEAAEQAVRQAEAEVRAAEARVEEMRRRIEELRGEAQDRAVDAYINPAEDQRLEQFFDTEDMGEATERQAFIDTIAARSTDVLDELGAAEDDLVDAEAAAEEAHLRVTEQEQAAEDRLVELEAAQEEQRRLREALQARIDDLAEHVDALAAEESRLSEVIAAQASVAPVGPDGNVERPASAAGLIWPVDGPVTSEYGMRWGRLHAGIDIGAPTGAPIAAAKGGRVFTGCGGGYGNCVMIDHGGGFVTLYAHMSQVYVSSGEVSQGDNIGRVGCTGSCTGPHLHFETRVNGEPQNPRNYLP